MILTVTPNAAVDKTFQVEDFTIDRVHRPSYTLTAAGGKGVNVARVYQTLGGSAAATGYIGGLNGKIVIRSLADEGIEDQFIRVRGESRLCIAIVDPVNGTQTEVNENGPRIAQTAVRSLERKVEVLLATGRFETLTLNGSLPPETPPNLYANLIEVASRAGVPTVLDASGEPLKLGIEARPWMVKPNRFELQAALGTAPSTREEAISAATKLRERGITVVAVTLGRDGAVLVTEQGAWYAQPPEIPFASAVASGDAFVAAFLWSWRAEHDPEAALKLATGAGAANAAVIGNGFCTREAICEAAAQARIERIE